MSTTSNVKYIIYKKVIYIIKQGPNYLWNTAAGVRVDCIHKALKHFSLKDERMLKYKGAEVVILQTKEVKFID